MGAAGQGADGSRWLISPRTLCFVRHEQSILLLKRGPDRRIFPNQYNGLGGHVERGEDVYSAAAREVMEESGLAVSDVRLRGIHHIDAGAGTGVMVFVFTATSGSRQTMESLEGTLEWVEEARIAELDLVEDLPLVLPRLLSMPDDAAPYFAHVSYDDDDQIVLRYADGMPEYRDPADGA